jgi:phosphoheptose isomerase
MVFAQSLDSTSLLIKEFGGHWGPRLCVTICFRSFNPAEAEEMNSGTDALIVKSIEESIKVKQALLGDSKLLGQIADVTREFVKALGSGHKVLLFGNGVFSRQIEALGAAGDVAVGITTSGKSPNVIKALAAAKAKGLVTVALTGKFGSMLEEVSRYCLCVPSDQTPRIQESHILIGHIVSQLTEMELFAE